MSGSVEGTFVPYAAQGIVTLEVDNGRAPAIRVCVDGVAVMTLSGPAGRLRELLAVTAGRVDVHPSITCPRCQRSSWHPEDIAQGYCGACHDWTSPPGQLMVPSPRDAQRGRR